MGLNYVIGHCNYTNVLLFTVKLFPLLTRSGTITGRVTVGVTSHVITSAICRFGSMGANGMCASLSGISLGPSVHIGDGCLG